MEVLPLVQHTRSSYRQRHEYAVVATFNADLKFFEQRILSNLRARNVLLLMDEVQYRLLTERSEATPSPRFAGIYYQVEPVIVPNGVFHPKFILCLSEERSRLVIGSGNLHRQGFMANAEIFSVIESDNNQPDESTILISEACDFLNDLAKGNFLSQSAKDFISKAMMLQPLAEPASNRQHCFFHTLHKPILEQVANRLGREQISEIHVMSPFIFGNDLIENLLTKHKNASVNIYLQNHRTQFNIEAITELCLRDPRVKLFEVSASGEERSSGIEPSSERYIHAKLLGFVSSKSAYSITGSPNFTRAALGLSHRNGNVETAIFTQHSLLEFKKLIQNQLLKVQPIVSLDTLIPESPKTWDVKRSSLPLRILSSKYGGAYLHIDFIYRDGNLTELSSFEVSCLTQGEEKHFPVSSQDTNKGHISVKCDLLRSATVVWICAKRISDKTLISSERQWLNFPQVADLSESGFTQGDFDRCTEIGGIEGVREALQIASSVDQPDWLIAFLQTWNLEQIFKANNPLQGNKSLAALAGRGPAQPLQAKHEFLQRGLATLIRPDLEEILESVVQDYRSKIFVWLGEKEAESVRMGLQFMLVFDLLCLLLMKGFQTLIAGELAKKNARVPYPQMQYGHVRMFARDFILRYLYNWEDFLLKGNHALYALADRRLPPNIYLFHNSRSAIAYSLAKNIAPMLDLEQPVVFNKDIAKLVGSYAKERCRVYLLLPDSLDTLESIWQNYDLVQRDSGIHFTIEQLRKSLQKVFADSMYKSQGN